MKLNELEIHEIIKKRIKDFKLINNIFYEGTIISVIDGIIKIYGLDKAMQGEMLFISKVKQYALVLNLEKDLIGAVILGSYINVKAGMKIKCTGKILEIPVGRNFLGRVVDALANPIDGKGSIKYEKYSAIESAAPGVIDRSYINKPLQTGYLAIDTMIPIGRGQRELIIGDRQTGKTSLAISTIINQKFFDIKCVYVAIGQKLSTIFNVVQTLKEYNALKHTIIISASASESASLQYLSPYAGCTLGEYFRDLGEDALIIYDDLSKHAIAYRQISLLLKRPPGREAFPGDIFYLHSRLLERSSQVNKKYLNKKNNQKKTFNNNKINGSLTALPIIETQLGDVSAFVPTNVISITDGQIFLESNLFNSGIRPAINPGISVSRVGSAAQTKIIKTLSGGIRTALAQYQELESFSKFSSDLDSVTKKQLKHGKKILELLKQSEHCLLSVADQAILLYAAEYRFLDDIKVKKINFFKKNLLKFFKKKYVNLRNNINSSGEYNHIIKEKLNNLLNSFKKKFFSIL
ncbi:F0F1 ATP synthase subunit alpha [Buchnera aphidicola]|uniref:F0F1 ATP synthase subunit alpha n=1 Tax=Buchnera aphidicola TaxID=9 RepID=UPI0030EECD4D